MAVAYDASSESHTGTSGSASEASFSWTHTPAGTPAGVLVFTFVNANANNATAVTYGGVSMTAVSGGRAVDTGGEPGDCKAWFLGSGIGTGAKTVQVTRTNNTNVMYAVCYTVTALSDTQATGVVLLQENQALTEQSVDDGTWDTNSLRFAGTQWGGSDIPTVGANSTQGPSIDFGLRTISTVYETTAGKGSRSVGWNTGATSDDVAFVALAIREAARSRQNTAVAPFTASGTGAETFTETGVATSAHAAVTYRFGAEGPTGYVRTGLGRMGVSTYDYWRQATAAAPFVAAGTDTAETSETATAVAPFTAAGAAEYTAAAGSTYDKTGAAQASLAALGDEDVTYTETGAATAAFVGAGADTDEPAEAGTTVAPFTAAGVSAVTHDRQNTAVAAFAASAADTLESSETGNAVAPFTAAGAAATAITYDKTGAAIITAAAAATRTIDAAREGTATTDFAAAGTNDRGQTDADIAAHAGGTTTVLTFPAEWAETEEELVLVLALALT